MCLYLHQQLDPSKPGHRLLHLLVFTLIMNIGLYYCLTAEIGIVAVVPRMSFYFEVHSLKYKKQTTILMAIAKKGGVRCTSSSCFITLSSTEPLYRKYFKLYIVTDCYYGTVFCLAVSLVFFF